jgi:Domain of unknown function (DUF1833)
MSLDLAQQLRIFFASAPQNVHNIQTIEISHSALSRTFNLWREPYTAVIQNETGSVTVEPCNFEIALAGSQAHLDQNFNIKLGTVDIEDIFTEQMDLVPIGTKEKVKIKYREYLSDNLTSVLAKTTLQAESISYEVGAATISAVSPRLNMNRTGELYTLKDIPMLRGF